MITADVGSVLGNDWKTIIGTVAALLALTEEVVRRGRKARKMGTTLVGRWIGKHIAPAAGQAAAAAATEHIREMVTAELEPIRKELSPNSGSSSFDKLTRLDQWREDFTSSVDAQFRAVNRHLTEQDRAMRDHLRDHAGRLA